MTPIIIILSLIGGLINRLRGWDAADWYEQRGLTPPKAATWQGHLTSRPLMALVSAALFCGFAYFAAGYQWIYAAGVLAALTTLSFTVLGGKGRSRTYSAYDGSYSTDDDYTKLVGVLIPGDVKIINHIRGMVESAFYCAVMTAPVFGWLFLCGQFDALFNYGACALFFAIGKALPALVPAQVSFPVLDFDARPLKVKVEKTLIRHALSEFLSGAFMTYWILQTII